MIIKINKMLCTYQRALTNLCIHSNNRRKSSEEFIIVSFKAEFKQQQFGIYLNRFIADFIPALLVLLFTLVLDLFLCCWVEVNRCAYLSKYVH